MPVIIEQFNEKQMALSGDTFSIREKIKNSWGGKWSAITKKWIMPENFKKEFLDADGIKYKFDENPKEETIIIPTKTRENPQAIAQRALTEDEAIQCAKIEFGNDVQIQYKPLHSKNCYKYREQIKAGGGKFDIAQKIWYVPLNFDDSFLTSASAAQSKERICSFCGTEGHDVRTCTACKICKKTDHLAKDCKCIHCGTSQMYHFSHRCPTLNKKFKFMVQESTGNKCGCSLQMGVCSLCEYACCKKARTEPCVCTICIVCDDHGRHCHGSHE